MYEKEALQVGEYIQKLAEKPDNLNNFVSYLTSHFPVWLEKYANTPESLPVNSGIFRVWNGEEVTA